MGNFLKRPPWMNKDFARSDAIRDELEACGILLLDSAEGTSWKIK
jgi:cysteinyl-tRNA synthetase